MKANVLSIKRSSDGVVVLEYQVLFTGDIFTARVDEKVYLKLGLDSVVDTVFYVLKDTDLIDIKYKRGKFSHGTVVILTEVNVVRPSEEDTFYGWEE